MSDYVQSIVGKTVAAAEWLGEGLWLRFTDNTVAGFKGEEDYGGIVDVVLDDNPGPYVLCELGAIDAAERDRRIAERERKEQAQREAVEWEQYQRLKEKFRDREWFEQDGDREYKAKREARDRKRYDELKGQFESK